MRFTVLCNFAALSLVAGMLGACSTKPEDLAAAIAADPASVSVHQVIQGPMWTITTDITRVNSSNTASTANGNGTAVNVPTGATVNPAPQKPQGGTTLTPGSPASAPGQ